jgi:DNA-binding sugar fermentation-stimulating protein
MVTVAFIENTEATVKVVRDDNEWFFLKDTGGFIVLKDQGKKIICSRWDDNHRQTEITNAQMMWAKKWARRLGA